VHAFRGYPECEPPWARNALTVDQAVRARGYVQATSSVAASTVWEILQDAGIPPAPERASSTWSDFLRSQADVLLGCDFFGTVTLSGARLYVFAVIEHANRQIRVLGATAHPTAAWVTQAAKNLVLDLEYRATAL
jgi:hypothetical protein